MLDSKVFLKSFPILFIFGFLLLLTIPNPLLVNEKSSTKEPEVTEEAADKDENGENSVKVDVNKSVQGETDQSSTGVGTCTVTKNGVTEVVPADQVTIDEKSSGDINIKVDCENSSSSSSNKTSIEN
ncbi:MAG TPA: hypothetical protein VIH52_04085, partial [Candidatus Nanoarchaeia archaeon]